jgi:hypothetical protein
MQIYIVLIILFLVVYIGLPKWVQLVLFIANCFIPGPIPFVDEVVMVALLLKPND